MNSHLLLVYHQSSAGAFALERMGGYLLEQGQLIAIPPTTVNRKWSFRKGWDLMATTSFMNVEGVNLMQIAIVSS